MAEIVCHGVNKKYGAHEVIPNFDLRVAEHEFIVFLGPSGCGKSTILRMIAGLEAITGGEVSINGKVVNDLEPRDRGIAMVFQNYALYPHMTIYDNIAFGLRRLGIPAAEIDRRVGEVVDMLGLKPVIGNKPSELSGGQQQRVAIARAMIKTPEVFLFDEPLSNLDAKLRAQMRLEIARLHKNLKTTTVYVTHDQMEAMTLADRIVLLNAGRIEQVGTPEEIYARPASLFVAGFIGTPAMNLLPATVGENGARLDGQGFSLPVTPGRYRLTEGQKVVFGLRPADLSRASDVATAHTLSGMVDMVEFHGDQVLVSFPLGAERISAFLPARHRPKEGDKVSFAYEAEAMHIFDAVAGHSLLHADD